MIEFETKKVEEKDKVILQLNNSLEVVRGKVRWVENKFSQELGLYHGIGSEGQWMQPPNQDFLWWRGQILCWHKV